MIQPDAKCVVNGHKINAEIIPALNALLNMEIIVGDVAAPEIRFTSESAQIVIPPSAGAETNEELDVVDSNNQAAKRWFLTTLEAGIGGEDTTAPKMGTSAGSAGGSTENTKREKLGGGASSDKNRNKLDRAAASGGAAPIGGNDGQGGNVNPPVNINNPQGRPLYDPTTGKAVPGTGNNLTGGGYPVGDGDFPPPRPIAPPLGGDFPPPMPGAPPLGGDEPRPTNKTKKEYNYGPWQQPPSVRQIIENQRQKYNDLTAKAERDASSLTMAERRFLYERQKAAEQYYQQQAEKDAEANERYINEQLDNQ